MRRRMYGYKLRPDGLFEHVCEFPATQTGWMNKLNLRTVRLLRSRSGVLVRVEKVTV